MKAPHAAVRESSECQPMTLSSQPCGLEDLQRSRIAYILSASHSGSTLLAMLLGAHHDVCSTGELKATSIGDPERYRCSCGSLIRQCRFWQQVSEAMARRGFAGFEIAKAGTSFYDAPSAYAARLLQSLYRGFLWEKLRDGALWLSPAWRRHSVETRKRNAALVESLHEVTGAKLIVDSSKLALRLKYLLGIPNLDIKIIRLIRDGRAVALTYTDDWSFADANDPALRGGGSGERRKTAQDTMSGAAREWRRSNEAADCLVAGLPKSQWLEVRYEQLCKNPEIALRNIYRFLEIDPAGTNLNFRSKEHHVIGNGMRFDLTSEIRLDERWRTHLSADDLAVFNRVAGDLNRRYGYI